MGNTFFKDFNWENYLKCNKDLVKVDTREKAWRHWCRFGKKENRPTEPVDEPEVPVEVPEVQVSLPVEVPEVQVSLQVEVPEVQVSLPVEVPEVQVSLPVKVSLPVDEYDDDDEYEEQEVEEEFDSWEGREITIE